MLGGFRFVRVACLREHENERIVRRNERKKGRREEERVKSQKPGKLKRSARESLRLPKEFAYLATFIIRVFGWQSLLRSWFAVTTTEPWRAIRELILLCRISKFQRRF